jgi:tripartite-type tricarboxylate transporter receptor subunit TctC
VKLGFSAVATTIAPAKAGNVRVIGVTSPTRSRWPDFPDVPTTQELGYESITFGGWVGISGPLNLPSFVTRTWNNTLQEMTRDPEMVSKIKQVGLEPYYLGSEEAKEFVSKEIEEGRRVWSLK